MELPSESGCLLKCRSLDSTAHLHTQRLSVGNQNLASHTPVPALVDLIAPLRSPPWSYLPGKVRNIVQGPEGPTALVPAVTPRPGAVGKDAKGEGVGLEPGRRDEAKG